MFRIPTNYKMEMSFEDATKTIKNWGSGDLLRGMELMNTIWDDFASGKLADDFADDYEFFDAYEYECNAYNKVFEEFKPLFV